MCLTNPSRSYKVIHVDVHPALNHYKAVRVFDPRLLGSFSHDIEHYRTIPELAAPSNELAHEFQMYCLYNDVPDPLDLCSFWKSMSHRFPLLAQVARKSIWMPVSSVDVERSFSEYKHILNDRREALTELNTKQLVMLYHNGDIEGRFAL